MVDPISVEQADYLLVESTYGGRRHDKRDPAEAQAEIVGGTIARGGTVIIPAFAVGRVQSLLFHFHQLKSKGRYCMSHARTFIAAEYPSQLRCELTR